MTPKPESETDPWQGVTPITVVGFGAMYEVAEVDAARAAEAAQHRQEIAAKDAEIARLTWNLDVTTLERDDVQRQFDKSCVRLAAVEAEHEVTKHKLLAAEQSHEAAGNRVIRLAVERDRLKAAFLELHATVKGECPSLLDPDRGGSDVLWALCDAALTPQGQSTDGETR